MVFPFCCFEFRFKDYWETKLEYCESSSIEYWVSLKSRHVSNWINAEEFYTTDPSMAETAFMLGIRTRHEAKRETDRARAKKKQIVKVLGIASVLLSAIATCDMRALVVPDIIKLRAKTNERNLFSSIHFAELMCPRRHAYAFNYPPVQLRPEVCLMVSYCRIIAIDFGDLQTFPHRFCYRRSHCH